MHPAVGADVIADVDVPVCVCVCETASCQSAAG